MMKKGKARPLKTDLHIHTAEDPLDQIRYTAKEIISKAADEGFEVLSITNHHRVTFDPDLVLLAKRRGILLIPGLEITIRRRHVLVLNPPPFKKCADFSSLAGLRRPATLIVAPHPYFPGSYSLNKYLLENLSLFDALEFCHFYSPKINFNLKALEVSKAYGLPMIGNSDAHFLSQFGKTYSMVHAEKNVESVFKAIRQNRVEVVSRPLNHREMGSIFNRFLRMKIRATITHRAFRPKSPPRPR